MKKMVIQFMLKIQLGLLAFLLATFVYADGPAAVAKSITLSWPLPIDSRVAFDTASRAEILLYLSVYKEQMANGIEPAALGVKTINPIAFNQWNTRFKVYWLNTYLDAMRTCKNTTELGCDYKGTDFESLLNYADHFKASLPEKFYPWRTMSQPFYEIYFKEQARLAALFPHPTSEILPFTNSEMLGDHFKDGEFMLTLDDGPTKSNDTAKYTALLRSNGIAAFFFALGDALDAKIKTNDLTTLKNMYQGQCLASHGYHHQSHQKWEDWKSSIDKTQTIIQQITGMHQAVSFRPPYGQLNENVAQYLANQHAPIILWNIDSQDWQNKITAEEVSVRVEKLMLLWRKGIILFHDVHQKAFVAIPDTIQFAKSSQLQWKDCTSLLEQ